MKENPMSKVTGGIYIPHLKHCVVTPVLDYLELGGKRAINMVTGTFLAEGYAGGYTYLKQLGNGPALGPEQMEPATYSDIWKNFLSAPKRSALAARLRNIAGSFSTDGNGIPKPEVLTGNLFYAAAMCRVFYLRIPEALPFANDATVMANYHKRYYNTLTGKAVAADNIARFQQAIGA